jgi:hypothetical protein
MIDTSSRAEHLLDPQGVVTVSVPCRHCTYDLRGLSFDGKCPECGTPIESSLGPWLIHFAPLDWLIFLVRGALLAAIVCIALIAFPAVCAGGERIRFGEYIIAAALLTAAVLYVVLMICVWWVLRRELYLARTFEDRFIEPHSGA